ncbi:MAG TPA: LysR family transcriptional regulator [Pseudomonadota bacterium]|nr:LysR family transcriptional regulator [Pseudomonadota bacterium]
MSDDRATAGLFRGVVPFVTVAQELSYRRAASRLGVSAAALSKAVKGLEDELGVVLLQRSSRAVSLTPEGESFFLRCREAIQAISEARQDAQQARSAPQGQVVISASFIVTSLVVRALQPLAQKYSRLSFRLHSTDRMARFAEEGVDLAVRVGEPQDADLRVRKLCQTRWVIVASPAYLAQHGVPQGIEDLAHGLRFLAPNGKARPWMLGGQPTELAGPLLVDHGPTLVDAALASMGAAQVLDFMVADLVAQTRLIPILDAYSQPGPGIYAVHARGRHRNANIRAVIDALLSTFAAV